MLFHTELNVSFLHNLIFKYSESDVRYCNVSSLSITVPKLESAPVFTSTPNDSITVNQGNNLTLECAAEGWPVPHITWEKYGGHLPVGRFSQLLGKHSPCKVINLGFPYCYVFSIHYAAEYSLTQYSVSSVLSCVFHKREEKSSQLLRENLKRQPWVV